MTLREHLVKFVTELRGSGVRVSVAESIDAMNAVAIAGLERNRMREALAAALIKDESDRAAFDALFERFFASPPHARGQRRHPDHPGMQESAATGHGRLGMHPRPSEREQQKREAHETESRSSIPKVGAPAEELRAKKKAIGAKESEQQASETVVSIGEQRESARAETGVEGARLAAQREIQRRPFTAYSDLEFEQARDALKPLERRFRIRVGRRMRIAHSGRINFRRTIRASIQRGGVMAELRFRARRPRHVDLLILADVSGSVRYAAELMLSLVAGARNCFRRVATFVFVDHLAEASFEQGHLVTSPAVDFYARSDFGRVLGELWNDRHSLLNRQTLVVILGDARNNRKAARADLLREITRVCRGVVWLNPEEKARWGAGDSAIEQYRKVVTALYPAGNLRELERALIAAC